MNKYIFSLLFCFVWIFLIGCEQTKDPNELPNKEDEGTLVRKHIVADELKECEMDILPNNYKLVWCDEFNYEGAIDEKKWSYEIGTGNGGWGNQEKQYYTNRIDNSYVSDGTLKIVAKKEAYSGSQYTSARLVSRNKGDFKYGFIEIKAKLPEGKGTWPALWMMPTTNEYGGWPNSGEIDIMEAVGSRPNTVLGTLHSGSNYGGNGRGKTISLANTATTFNLYQLEWTVDSISFLVNGNKFYTLEYNHQWDNLEKRYMFYPYDQKFFLIMNVAMGGTLGGAIDSAFTQSQMEVDYVRVYEKHDENDTIAPNVPEFNSFFSTSSTINLEWDDVHDDYGIKHYEIVVNNKQIGATIGKSYTIKGLDADTSYKVQLIAVDFKDNYSISQKYSIRTIGRAKIPGDIVGTGFSDIVNGTIANGVSSESEKILRMSGNSQIYYDIECHETSIYKFVIRASVMKQLNVKIYLIENDIKTEILSSELDASYGKYNDINLDSKMINKGNYTLLIEFSGDDVDSILLNYLSIKK